MSSTWNPLLLHRKHSDIPPLLVKYEFGPSDYKVWVTDLSYIWSESLDRKQITKRALNLDTSIDPSEDSAQMHLFLNSIADSLRQRPGSSVNLDQSDDIKQLTLHTSTPLPSPLQPLEWHIVLILAPQIRFASAFVLPLLRQQLTAKMEKTSLLQQLKEKDNVISKLIDKMQGDGIDLGKAFPGAVPPKSGSGPTARWAVAKSIKALGEFDQTQWEGHLAKDNRFSRNMGDLLPQVFDDDGKDPGEGLQITDYGEWWKRVGRKDSNREEATPAIGKTESKQEIGVEDEFQRQSTPSKSSAQAPRREGLIMDPEPKISSNLEKNDPYESDLTTDESDDDLQSSPFKPPPSRADDGLASGFAKNAKGIPSEPMDLHDDGLTASASDIDHSPAKTHLVPKSKPKLGRIGGKDKDSSPDSPAVLTTKPKLGKIGGKGKLGKSRGTGSVSSRNEGAVSNKREDPVSLKRETRDQTAVPRTLGPEAVGRMAQRPLEPSPPRETSQERANKKREQLKRELESKSHAATKKKRRF